MPIAPSSVVAPALSVVWNEMSAPKPAWNSPFAYLLDLRVAVSADLVTAASTASSAGTSDSFVRTPSTTGYDAAIDTHRAAPAAVSASATAGAAEARRSICQGGGVRRGGSGSGVVRGGGAPVGTATPPCAWMVMRV